MSVSVLVVVGVLMAYATPVGARGTVAATERSATNVCKPSKLPKVPSSLAVFKLKNTPAPTTFMNHVLSQTPGINGLQSLSKLSLFEQRNIQPPSNFVGAEFNGHLSMYEDLKTGDAQVFSNLSDKGSVSGDAIPGFLDSSGKAAQAMLNQYRLIPKDPTHVVLSKAQPLMVNTDSAAGGQGKPAAEAAWVTGQRFVGKYPVQGDGSRILIGLDTAGNVTNFVQSWQTASPLGRAKEKANQGHICAAINAQVNALKPTSAQLVNISLVYYDQNNNAWDGLAPAFKFTVVINWGDKQSSSPDVMVGYLGIGKYGSPPKLNATGGTPPSNDQTPGLSRPPTRRAASGDPCVGRYVVRNDDPGWVNDANGFWSGLSAFWGPSYFSNCQYYWGEPFQYESLKDSRANLMNITLTEGHGDWWDFTTLQNCCDSVNINGDIPYPGFGGSANGNLDFWTIHSCEVVPSPSDTSSWADPWWTIFGGMHAVMGYRTIMYINDSAGQPYATSLLFFAPVVSAWLNDVMALPDYASHPVWHGPEGAHGIGKLMGRPSAIAVTGHSNDIAYDTSNLGRAGSLTVFWFPG